MKNVLLIIVACILSLSGFQAAAANKNCTPTNISYCKKVNPLLGEAYTTYNVRCSDGTKHVISAWKKKKKWCVGKKQRRCTNSQYKAAKMACQGR